VLLYLLTVLAVLGTLTRTKACSSVQFIPATFWYYLTELRFPLVGISGEQLSGHRGQVKKKYNCYIYNFYLRDINVNTLSSVVPILGWKTLSEMRFKHS
jgi:hypothetical protein